MEPEGEGQRSREKGGRRRDSWERLETGRDKFVNHVFHWDPLFLAEDWNEPVFGVVSIKR